MTHGYPACGNGRNCLSSTDGPIWIANDKAGFADPACFNFVLILWSVKVLLRNEHLKSGLEFSLE